MKNNFSPEHRVGDFGRENFLGLDRENIAREHDEIGEFAGGDAAFAVVFARDPRGINGVGLDRLFHRERLLGMPRGHVRMVALLARDGGENIFQRIERRDGGLVEEPGKVGDDIHAHAALDHRAPRKGRLRTLGAEVTLECDEILLEELFRGHVGGQTEAASAREIVGRRIPRVNHAEAPVARAVRRDGVFIPVEQEVQAAVADDVNANVEAGVVGRGDVALHGLLAFETKREVTALAVERGKHQRAVDEILERRETEKLVTRARADVEVGEVRPRLERRERVDANRELAAFL